MTKNTKVNEVFLMQCNVDDPRFEGFAFADGGSIRGKDNSTTDFMPDDIYEKGRNWTVTRMAHLWTPRLVKGRVRPYNDYPCCTMYIPAFSQKAVDALRDMLEPNGELLPLVSTVGSYYAYNVTTVADVLDHDRSEVKWFETAKRKVIAMSIDRYEFHPEKLEGLSIFRIVEEPLKTYVTNLFVERVREHKLRGFVFVKLWPHPLDQTLEENDIDYTISAQSVILQLQIAKSKPNKMEKQRVNDLMDQIDMFLMKSEEQGTYLGSLEGNQYERKEAHLFLSCPDAHKLADALIPMLRSLAWERGVKITRRFGAYDDAECPEEGEEL